MATDPILGGSSLDALIRGLKSPSSPQQVVKKPSAKIGVYFSEKFQGLFRPARYKVRWGGRGGMKSWQFARALISIAFKRKVRIGCFRELQNSIKDSVHRLLQDQIETMGLTKCFYITKQSIIAITTGAEFIFKGLRHNATEIKSTEGIDIAWVEEAQLVSKESWDLLIPTIRKDGSEIWVTFNPIEEEDDTYQRFVISPPPDADIIKVGWKDNPWFPSALEAERQYLLKKDPDSYGHIWEGDTLVMTDAVIFRNRYVVENFETPTDPVPTFYHGADFGYSSDPSTLMRMYITGEPPDEELWIDREAWELHVEIDALPAFYERIETSRTWPIMADSARPDTISYLNRQGFNISGADKWSGSVEEGVAHLRGFKMIHIHATNCPRQAEEARLYRYKVDKNGKITPIILDAWNHCWDSDRYALDGFIKSRGVGGVWGKL